MHINSCVFYYYYYLFRHLKDHHHNFCTIYANIIDGDEQENVYSLNERLFIVNRFASSYINCVVNVEIVRERDLWIYFFSVFFYIKQYSIVCLSIFSRKRFQSHLNHSCVVWCFFHLFLLLYCIYVLLFYTLVSTTILQLI